MNGFDKRRQRKMKCILTAAFELFKEKGIDNVKITDIAQKANVSKVSIYNYFGSKDELVRQVLYDYMDSKIEEFNRFINSDLPFREKFDMLWNMKISTAYELGESFINSNILSPQAMEFLNTFYESKGKPLFISLIEQGKREGVIDSDLSNETVLMYLGAFRDILQSPMDFKQRVDLGKLIFYGLKGK